MQKTINNYQVELDRLRVRIKDAKTAEELAVYSHKKFCKYWKSHNCDKSKEAIMPGLSSVTIKYYEGKI